MYVKKFGMEVEKMYEKKKPLEISDFKIVLASFICLGVFELFPTLNHIAVDAAALATIIFCCVATPKESAKAVLTRLKAVLIGFVLGSAVVFIDGLAQNKFVFVILAALGMLGVLTACWTIKLPYIQAKISCIIYVLVIAVMQGSFRITYGLMFILGSAIGGCIAVVTAFVFDFIEKSKLKA